VSDLGGRRALDDTLLYLDGLVADAVPPAIAVERLAAVRAKHPDLRLDVVWDASAYASTFHYDVLLRAPGEPTVSVSVCPATDTPWPLRGVRLASDQDLVRVNGETLKVRDAMECLDFVWDDARILRSLVDLCLIEEAVKERSIVPLAEHTQRALDAWRTAHGLLTARETHAWLDANALPAERLTELLHARAAEYALRDQVAGADVDAYATSHARAFDVAHVARMRVRTRARADLLAAQVAQRGFNDVMDEEFAARRLVAMRNGHLGSIRRRDLPAEQAGEVFSASAGDVIGPLESAEGIDLLRVIRIEVADPAQASTRHAIVDALFEEWLTRRRAEATIEWFWGPAQPDASRAL
jgi:putative peptide maturation system protein